MGGYGGVQDSVFAHPTNNHDDGASLFSISSESNFSSFYHDKSTACPQSPIHRWCSQFRVHHQVPWHTSLSVPIIDGPPRSIPREDTVSPRFNDPGDSRAPTLKYGVLTGSPMYCPITSRWALTTSFSSSDAQGRK